MNQQSIHTLLNQLNYNFDDFSITHFIQHIEGYRQRSIICYPHPFSPGMTGLWIPGKQRDYIIYQSETHPIHQIHIILHEIAHMLLGHPLHKIDHTLPPALLRDLEVDPEGYLRSLDASGASDIHEQEAEYFVQLIQRQVMGARRLAELTRGQSSIPEIATLVERIAFEDQD